MVRTIAKDYDEKRVKILKSAARVFAQEGMARASMAQLAKEIGISKANIYHYYDGKDALLFDILDTYLSTLRDRLCSLPLADLTPQEKLHAVVSDALLAYEGMDNEHKIQLEGIPLLAEDQQEVLRSYQRDIVKLLSGILEEVSPATFEGDPQKLREATMSVFGMINWFYMWNSKADSEARERYSGVVSRMALSGIEGL